jgi:serine/threonine protein kinase/tetratricopeptide (TPR) repeat protein
LDTLGEPLWIGQYRLTSRIATGGMAEVYVGRHISPTGDFGPMVAVKRLLPHLVKDTAIVRMFLNEARITAQIDHPNVVKIFELGQVEGEPFIAMELLEGRTWAELRGRAAEDGRRMNMGVALTVLCSACRGLDAAHNAKDEEGQPLSLVHRDFTPDNIHVGVRGEVKVIDFGIAKTRAWGSGTEPGTLKGKFFYMSPEMILAKPVDHRADIFAAGVMLYEQLCGRRPFTGNSIDEVVMAIARGKPVPPTTYDPAVPRALEAICLTALNRNPESRFQSLGDFVDALEAVGGEAQLAADQDVGDYVSQLFPEKTDTRRQTLRRAREADPSVPFAKPLEVPAQAFEQTYPSPTAPVAEPVAAPLPAAPSALATTGRSRALPVVGALVLLFALGGGAFVVLRKPALSPTETLTLASQSTVGADRARLLTPLGRNPETTDEQLKAATGLLLELKQYDATLELVDRWLERTPKSLEARLAEAQAATRTRKGKRAEAAIAAAAALSAKNDARADVALAELRELQGDPGGAMEAWKSAASKANSPRSSAREGYWLSQLGRLDEANEVLTRALKKQSDPALQAELGFVKYRKEQPDEALKLLRAAVKERPTMVEGHYYLGAVLYRKGDVKGARAEYLEADKLSGSDQRALAALCEMEQQQSSSELDDAKKRIRERFPADAEAMLARCATAKAAE